MIQSGFPKRGERFPMQKATIPVYSNGQFFDNAHEFNFSGEVSLTKNGDQLNIAFSETEELLSNSSVGATTISASGIESLDVGRYVVIDPYTVECEIRQIVSVAGSSDISFSPALAYSHSVGDRVIYTDSDIINARWFGALGDGITDDVTALQRGLTAARSTDAKTLHIPGGTYIIGSLKTGAVLDMSSTNALVIRGDGMGITTLRLGTGWTQGNNTHAVIYLKARYQQVLDLTIDYTGMTRSPYDKPLFGVACSQVNDEQYWSRDCVIRGVEVKGMNGYVGGNPAALGGGCSWWTRDVYTTLSTAVTVPGSQAVTIGSGDSIYRGKRLRIGYGTANFEEVVVTGAVPDTEVTATFANVHSIGEKVESYSQGRQHILFEDCYVHDCPSANAFVISASCYTLKNCRMINGGTGVAQHAIYLQGGYNVIDGCHMEGWESYHIHGYFSVPRMDCSGNKITNCLSINPGYRHLLFSASTDDGTNTEITDPDASLSRYQLVQNNVFRNTNGFVQQGCDLQWGQTVYDGNVHEDLYPQDGGAIVGCYTPGSAVGAVISNNVFRFMQTPSAVSGYCINGANNSVISGNMIYCLVDSGAGMTGIQGGKIVKGNVVIMHQGNGITVNGNTPLVEGNHVVIESGTGSPISSFGTDMVVKNNYFEGPGYILNTSGGDNLSAKTGIIEGNLFIGSFRYSGDINAGLKFLNNRISPNVNGSYGMTWQPEAKRLLVMSAGGSLNYGRFVKLSGIDVVELLTTDTNFFGVTPTSAAAGAEVLVAFESGAIITMKCSNAWTAGHIGVPSTATAGMVMDSGSATVVDSRKAAVIFLDTGGAPGDAMVMIL